MPQPAAVAQHADSGPKSVCLSAQGAELRGGMILVRRLVEPQVVARQHLVGADHQGPGMLGSYALRFQLRPRSEEHTSELQSLMCISYAVFSLNKKQSHRLYRPSLLNLISI